VFAEPTPGTDALQLDEITRTPPPVASAILFDTQTRDYRGTLREVDVPMLVCAGTAKTRGSLEAVECVAELAPDATVERFERSGHRPPFEEPERFERVLREFVESL
jgi:pimeloyl-ACP methyl ester carboxylesterase